MPDLQAIIDRSRRIVFFGGAGVSTASGIPDFRGPEGLYQGEYGGLSAEALLSASCLYLEPERFFDFYRRHLLFPEARLNAAHRKLVELERADRLRAVVTQNVDGLHREAGSLRLYEVHGSLRENYCMECGARFSLAWMAATRGVPRCPECGGVVRPDITLYGEAPNVYVCRGARREINACDTLIVAGTSLTVEPAASMLEGFCGRDLVVINREPLSLEGQATLTLRGDVAQVMERLRI